MLQAAEVFMLTEARGAVYGRWLRLRGEVTLNAHVGAVSARQAVEWRAR